MTQTAPLHALALAAAVLLPALLLGGCDAIYDDTKGWANRLEAEVLETAHEMAEPDPEDAPQSMAAEPAPPAVPLEPVETAELILPQPEAAAPAEPALPVNGDPGVMAAPAMSAQAPAQPVNGDPGVMAGATGAQMAAASNSNAKKANSSKDVKALPPHPVPKPEVPATQQAKSGTPAGQAAPDADRAVVLHLSSLRSEEAAKREWSDLQQNFPRPLADMQAEIRRTELGDRGTFYRVLAGPLPSQDRARQVCAELKSKDVKQYCRILPSRPNAS